MKWSRHLRFPWLAQDDAPRVAPASRDFNGESRFAKVGFIICETSSTPVEYRRTSENSPDLSVSSNFGVNSSNLNADFDPSRSIGVIVRSSGGAVRKYSEKIRTNVKSLSTRLRVTSRLSLCVCRVEFHPRKFRDRFFSLTRDVSRLAGSTRCCGIDPRRREMEIRHFHLVHVIRIIPRHFSSRGRKGLFRRGDISPRIISRRQFATICSHSRSGDVVLPLGRSSRTTFPPRFIGAARQLVALLLGHPQHSSAINSRGKARVGVARCSCTICSCTWPWHVLPADNNRRRRRRGALHRRASNFHDEDHRECILIPFALLLFLLTL